MKLTDLKLGDRVRLDAPMRNSRLGGSSIIPVEDIPVGTCGTVVWECAAGQIDRFSQVTVKWDNGRTLGVLPHDVITREKKEHDADGDRTSAAGVAERT